MKTTTARPPVKTASAVHFDSTRITRRNRLFGIGLSRPDRERRAPFALADLDAYRDLYACPPDAPTEGEVMDRFYALTMSRSEYRDFRAEVRAAELDRYVVCEPAELDEWGIDAARLEEMARESAELDRLCGYATTTW